MNIMCVELNVVTSTVRCVARGGGAQGAFAPTGRSKIERRIKELWLH